MRAPPEVQTSVPEVRCLRHTKPSNTMPGLISYKTAYNRLLKEETESETERQDKVNLLLVLQLPGRRSSLSTIGTHLPEYNTQESI